MSIVASAIFRADHTVLCARTYVPRSRSAIVSLLDGANKQAQASGRAAGTLAFDDHVVVFQVVDGQLIILVVEAGGDVQEATALLDLLGQSLDAAADPFEALAVLDELSAGGAANSFLLANRDVRGRIEMHSDAEQRYLEDRRAKEKEAEAVRKQREAEIAKEHGGGILSMFGLGKT